VLDSVGTPIGTMQALLGPIWTQVGPNSGGDLRNSCETGLERSNSVLTVDAKPFLKLMGQTEYAFAKALSHLLFLE
jgi:hypothetical protein